MLNLLHCCAVSERVAVLAVGYSWLVVLLLTLDVVLRYEVSHTDIALHVHLVQWQRQPSCALLHDFSVVDHLIVAHA